MSRSFGGTSLTLRSPMRISPPLISSRPAIMRSRVDLPQPEGPTRTVKDPSAMSMSTPCSTAVSPKLFRTDWIVTLAMGDGGGGHPPATAKYGEPRPCRHEGKPVERGRERRAHATIGPRNGARAHED